jgi:hypothetical protein
LELDRGHWRLTLGIIENLRHDAVRLITCTMREENTKSKAGNAK